MLTSIRIEGFRGFRAFEKAGLGRVNLLVGRNNAGKTRLLEAIELLLRADTPSALWDQPVRRNEVLRPPQGEITAPLADVRHLFTGHTLDVGNQLTIEGGGGAARRLRVQVEADVAPRNGKAAVARLHAANLLLKLTVADDAAETLDLIAGGGLEQPSLFQLIQRRAPRVSPVCFIGASQWDEASFVALWEDIVLTSAEADVVRAIQIVEPRVERVASAHDSFVIRLRDGDDRLPIGAMGDGAKRVLGLAIQLARSAGGALLVDEIDNGLHYSVMRPVWRLLIEAASRLNVQVFAASHSLDCLQALAAVTEEPGVDADSVLVHRLELGTDTAITYSAAELRVAIAQEMEIR